MITVTLPDGRRVDIQTDDPKRAAQLAHGWAQQHPKAERTTANETLGVLGHLADGALPGASRTIGGALNTLSNAAQAPFSDKVDFHPADAFVRGQREQDSRNRLAKKDHPYLSNAATAVGFVGGLALPAANVARGAGLAARSFAAAKTAGTYGLASGAMSSDADTVGGRVSDALGGGAAGLVGGGLTPSLTRAASKLVAPVAAPLARAASPYVGRGLEALGERLPGRWGQVLTTEGQQIARDPTRALANQRIAEAIPNGRQALAEVQRRQAMGVPAALADTSENARRAYGSAARATGPATAAVRRAIDQRQQEASERVADHIRATLGPTANVEQQAQALRQQARSAARPLYEASDAQDIPFTEDLQELMSRPAARAALRDAGTQLRNEGADLTRYGIRELPEGDFELTDVPTMQAYDRVKTALDNTVFAGNSPMASPEVTRASRGANTIRSRLLELMDGNADEGIEALNPAWAPARQAYAGPTQARQSLELGQQMAKAGPDDVTNAINGLSDTNADFFRLGHRSALANDVQSLGDYGNAGRRLNGSANQRNALQAVYGDRAAPFMDRLNAEHEANQTYRAIRGNSQTADRMASDVDQNTQAGAAAQGALQAILGHLGAGASTALRGLATVEGRQTAAIKSRMAEVLGATDIDAINSAIRDMTRARARRSMTARTRGQVEQRGTRSVAELVAAGIPAPAEYED